MADTGSPPRARGRPGEADLCRGGRGLTPACAGTSSGPLCNGSMTRAHPRVRGDVTSTRTGRRSRMGSPPRARGRRPRFSAARSPPGLTPACAGTSPTSPGRATGCWAHPRVRGDVVILGESGLLGQGSPPRARGRRRPVHLGDVAQGLTPACAGTSTRTPTDRRTARAHPRVRGDVALVALTVVVGAGSPPRARGRPRSIRPGWWRSWAHPRVRGDVGEGGRDFGLTGGLTPACAGTSRACRPGWVSRRAHPRVRGDVSTVGLACMTPLGSPPRARGRHQRHVCQWHQRGLTPACAGTSGGQVRHRLHFRAHPRVRGDVVRMLTADELRQGSPPRARGRPWRRAATSGGRGLTPACAGTSGRRPPTHSTPWAHPRVRGDVQAAARAASQAAGSPPRARGRREQERHPFRVEGLTPACAGTSRWRMARGVTPRAHPRVRGDVHPRS